MVGAYRATTGLLEFLAGPGLTILSRRGGEWPHRNGSLPGVPGGVWIHAASAGEVKGISPLARHVSASSPLLLTAHTAAGEAAATRISDSAEGRVFVARAPFDLPGVMRRAGRTARPAALVVAETEIWPNLIRAGSEAGVSMALVNARISDRTIGRYSLVRGLTRPLLRSLRAIAAQSEIDRERFVALGALPESVRVTGSMKHDLPGAEVLPATVPWPDDPIVVLGSLRDGEEDLLAEALRQVAVDIPNLRIVAAPRHLHRRSQVGRAFHARGFPVAFRSEGAPRESDRVVILDTMGELASFYAVARVAFVGGTLLPFGGHNVVEPAALGVPVVHGPFVANCRLEALALARNGASAQAASLESLAQAFRWLLTDEVARRKAAAAGLRTREELSGATDRTLTFLRERGVWPA